MGDALRRALKDIEARAMQAEIYHPQLGTEKCFADIHEVARNALQDAPNDELAYYKKRCLETSIHAHGWMEAHDKLKAGLPYKFPAPVDKDELRARVAKLEEALTPSAETKAAYMGEFAIQIPGYDMRVDVPWTTIKEIMKAIMARAGVAE